MFYILTEFWCIVTVIKIQKREKGKRMKNSTKMTTLLVLAFSLISTSYSKNLVVEFQTYDKKIYHKFVVSGSTTFGVLKQKIAKKMRIPKTSIKILWGGKPIDDNKKVSQYQNVVARSSKFGLVINRQQIGVRKQLTKFERQKKSVMDSLGNMQRATLVNKRLLRRLEIT